MDDARAPLLAAPAEDKGAPGRQRARSGSALQVVVQRVAAARSRLLLELHHSVAVLLVVVVLCTAAAARAARALLPGRADDVGRIDAGDDATAAADDAALLPPGHPRGVALWTPAAGSGDPAVIIHSRIFAPPCASEAVRVLAATSSGPAAPSCRRAVPQALLLELRRAAAAGAAVLLLPPTGGRVATWAWSDTIRALNAAGYWVRSSMVLCFARLH